MTGRWSLEDDDLPERQLPPLQHIVLRDGAAVGAGPGAAVAVVAVSAGDHRLREGEREGVGVVG